jgi:uncharacterized 2Fe-2S/4Fe-4S cluster protein (DUF4445 family)
MAGCFCLGRRVPTGARPVTTSAPASSRVTVEAAAGLDLLEATRRAGVEVETPCGGEGTCGRCFVRVLEGDVASDSVGRLPAPALAAGYVLGCRTRLVSPRVIIEVPEHLKPHEGQFAEDDAERLVDPELLPTPEELSPLVRKAAIRVPAPQLEDGLSDLDRLSRAAAGELATPLAGCSLSALRSMAEALRAEDGLATLTVRAAERGQHVVAVEAGDTTDRHYGVAVDLGTTSVAVQLVDLTTGTVLATRSDYNAQIPLGVDVISRINTAARPGRLEELRTRALQTINELVNQVAFGSGVNPTEIHAATISGNTVMTHLLLGLPPEQIRLEPYTPTVRELPELAAGELGLGIFPDAPVHLSPCVGSYVGGDITAGLLCSTLTRDTHGVGLFIDIGTNGELVVGNAEFLMACACSAGPAFEGGGIRCGTRAATGAIEKVAIDPDTARPTCSTIGDAPPRGICGSGLIDLLANLLRCGFIDRRGSLDRSGRSPHIQVEGKTARFVVVPAEESATGEPITISETEIDNVIRAKAAIYSATTLMLERVGLQPADLGRIDVAGSFGRFLDLDQAIVIGMLPDVPRDRYRYLGNASLAGSYVALLSETHRRRQLEIARHITYIELSTDPRYMDQYTAALFLPHTDLSRFPSA